ncbi:hypothetical protein Hanom_Chr16g01487481 [Helianthus anomalus]
MASWILSFKLLLISTAIISVAVTIKLSIPFLSTGLPAILSTVATWLKPPYLYVIINGIIITIAATTRFQHPDNQSQPQVPNTPPPSDLISNSTSFGVMEIPPVSYDVEPTVTVEPPVVYESKEVVGVSEDEFVTSGSTWKPLESVVVNSPPSLRKKVDPEFGFPVKEKQPVISRFANSRKPVKASPEGVRALRVLKPKKHETLETTWKMITDGRQLPLTRHLRKSDTFDNPSENLTAMTKTKIVKKSETFKDRTTTTTTYANQNDYPSTNSKLKKDVSLSQDELNRRVEAFIKKFNDDMRLQRQESLKQYMEMVKGGAR